MRRTVRNKRLAHIARTLGWQLKAARHRMESKGLAWEGREREFREERQEQFSELDGTRNVALDLQRKLARIPRIIRWAFRAL
jgi:hypothetical protein